MKKSKRNARGTLLTCLLCLGLLWALPAEASGVTLTPENSTAEVSVIYIARENLDLYLSGMTDGVCRVTGATMISEGVYSIPLGGTVTLEFAPMPGYELVNVDCAGTSEGKVTINGTTVTITGVGAELRVTATWRETGGGQGEDTPHEEGRSHGNHGVSWNTAPVKTGDMGILLYEMLALLSGTGSVVLLSKREKDE